MTQHDACPKTEYLRQLLDESLSKEDEATLAAHLEGCEACQRTLEGLAAGGQSWEATLRLKDGAGEQTLEPALERAVEALEGGDPHETQAETSSGANDLSFLDPPKTPEHLGRLDDYEILEVIGRGGMGIVLKGFDETLHRVVAIKVLAPQLATSATARKRFLREASAAAAVAHEHVVAIHAIAKNAPVPYLVMQFIAGISLEDRVRRSGALEVKEVLRIGMQAASGLAAAHAQGLVHRDVKPGNILLENGVERVKLTDFGLARAVDDASLTQSGVIAGTPLFMAPEQARGETVDHRSDLFSLGSVLYTLCTGRPPFRAGNTMAVLKRVCDDTPRPIREVNPDVPDWLAAIVMKLLAKEPANRFQTAAEVADLFGQYLAHLQQPNLVARPPSVIPLEFPSRQRAWKIGLAVMVLPIILVTALSLIAQWWHGRLGGTGGPVAHETGKEEPAARRPLTAEELAKLPSPLDGHKRADIPPDLLALAGGEVAPPELVAILAVKGERTSAMHCVAFSPDGKMLASGGEDHTVRLWDLGAWQEGQGLPPVRSLTDHTGDVFSVAFSPDGRLLASGSFDGTIVLWNVAERKALRILVGHSKKWSLIAFSPDGRTIAAGSEDGKVRLWDVATGTPKEPLCCHEGQVRAVAFSPDGKTLASVAVDGLLQLSDLENGRCFRTIRNANGFFFTVAFRSDGKRLAAGSSPDNSVHLFDLDTKNETVLAGHTEAPTGLSFHPAGNLIATGGCDGTLRVWHPTPNGTQILTFGSGPFGTKVLGTAFSPEGRYLATANDNGTITILRTPQPPKPYDPGPPRALPDPVELAKRPSAADVLKRSDLPAEQREKLPPEVVAILGGPPFALPEGDASWMTFSSDGKMLAVPCGNKLVVFDAHDGRHLRTLDNTGRVFCAAFSPDSKRLAAGNRDAETPVVKVWDVETWEQRTELSGHTGPINAVAFSPDGKQVATASGDGTAKVYVDGKGIELKGHTGPVYGVTFTRDGKRVITAGHDKKVRVWDTDSGKPVKTLEGHSQGVMNVTLSPGGKYFASGDDEEWKLWDAETLKEIRTVAGPAAWLAFAPDCMSLLAGAHNNSGNADSPHVIKRWSIEGKELASFELKGKGGWAAYALRPDDKTFFEVTIHTEDRLLRAYDARSGTELSLGPVGQVWSVAVSPDGKTLASTTAADTTVRLWDLATRHVRHSLSGPQQSHTVAFSPDGKLLAAGGHDGLLFLWDPETGRQFGAMPAEAAEISQVAFSPDGRLLASAVGNGLVRIWEVSTCTLLRTVRADPINASCVAFSLDGKTLITGGREGIVRLFEVGSGWEVGSLSVGVGSLRWFALGPDGLTLAGSGDGGTAVRVWDLATHTEKHRLKGPDPYVSPGGAWHADGRRLAIADGASGMMRLWDLGQDTPRSREIRLFPEGTTFLHGVAFTPEGRYAVTANPDGTLYVLRLAKRGEVFGVSKK
jgi:WD40 repeat protein/serine/threonine protein kinase